MIWRASVLILFIGLLTSCNRLYEKALKSTDKDFIANAADSLYSSEKWAQAIELYDRVIPSFAATDRGRDLNYSRAYANFYDKNYRLAAYQFKNFVVSYPTDSLREDMAFQSAYCYYKGSPEYNLDQSNTYDALVELQQFIDDYPDSPRVKEANELIEELQGKLERKFFEIAKIYFKTLKFQAAAIAFDNYLDDFPDSPYREEAMMYSLRAKHDLALNSTALKKEVRLKDAQTQYRLLTKAYPETQYMEEAKKLKQDVEEAFIENEKLFEEIRDYKRENINN